MTQTIVGIDPGVGGAIALLRADRLWVYPTPTITVRTARGGKRTEYDEPAMGRILAPALIANAFIEEAVARPMMRRDKEGKRQPVGPGQVIDAGRLMFGYGLWRGILAGRGIPYQVVPPQAWQKAMLAGMPKGDTKASSILVAQRLWPDASFRRTERCTKAHDGMTDAALIAEFGRRQLTGA